MSDEAVPDYRALVDGKLSYWEQEIRDFAPLKTGTDFESAVKGLRAALAIVEEEHRIGPGACQCGGPWPCPRAEAALERVWNAIK